MSESDLKSTWVLFVVKNVINLPLTQQKTLLGSRITARLSFCILAKVAFAC